MRPVLILFCVLAVALIAFATPAMAGPPVLDSNSQSFTLELPVSYEILPASFPVAHAAICTAGRSAALVGKVAVAPVRLVAKLIERKPLRSALAKAIANRRERRESVGGARLICHRCGQHGRCG